MKNENNSSKFNSVKFSGVRTTFSVLLIVTAFSATQVFAQKKTSSTSSCVDIAADSAKTVKQVWANQDYQPYQQAIGSLRAASVFALGENLDAPPLKANSDYRLQNWLMAIGQNPAWKAKFDDSLTIKDATDYLVENELIKNHDDGWRAAFVNGIFDRIYGKFPTKAESDNYVSQIKAKKTWYSPIFLAEKNKLNQDSAQREEMIKRAFQRTLNRQPTVDEIKYWKPRKEIYNEIIAKIKN